MTRTISAAEAEATFRELMGSVRETSEPVVVEEDGEPQVVVIAARDYDRLVEERAWAAIEETRRLNKGKDPDEIFADVTRVAEAVRQGRYE